MFEGDNNLQYIEIITLGVDVAFFIKDFKHRKMDRKKANA